MGKRSIVATFCAFAAIGLLWALAMPINAGPDEDQHMIWAASAARLQLEPVGPPGRERLAAPSVLYVDHCFQFIPTVSTAACQDGPRDDPTGDRRSDGRTQAPFYHFAVGLPSLATSAWKTAYLMRVGHVAIVAALFTLGVWSMAAKRQTPGSIALTTIAFTPMVAFLSGVVNPSGPAIASAFAVWTGGLALRHVEHSELRQRAAAVAVPAAVFLVVRRDSILWLTLIAVVIAGYAGGRRMSALLRSRAVRAGFVGGTLLTVTLFLVWGKPTAQGFASGGASSFPPGSSSASFGQLPRLMEHMIGKLGWLDVLLPRPVVIIWYGLVVVAVFVAIGASRRDAAAVTGVLALTLLLPFVLGTIRYNYYQGRYGLPLAIGIPILAAASVSVRENAHFVNSRMAKVIVWTVATLSTVSFAVALRRFTVSSVGPWPDVFTDPVWAPPLPTFVLVPAYAAVAAGIAVLLSRMISASELRSASGEAPVGRRL